MLAGRLFSGLNLEDFRAAFNISQKGQFFGKLPPPPI